jgi:RNA polymerase sigma-70 factor, ECF subfamily
MKVKNMADDSYNLQDIYNDFRPRILRYLSRMVGEDEAEDLTQEVLVKIDRALKIFRGESQLSTWIYQIATNAALDKLRNPYFREQHGKLFSIEAVERNEEDKDLLMEEGMASADQRVILQEMNGCIREIIDTLPGDYRSVIVLSELEGLKNKEIAEVLGVTLQTVKIRLHRGRAMLKKELSTACVFYRDERNEFACDRKNNDIKLLPLKKIGE